MDELDCALQCRGLAARIASRSAIGFEIRKRSFSKRVGLGSRASRKGVLASISAISPSVNTLGQLSQRKARDGLLSRRQRLSLPSAIHTERGRGRFVRLQAGNVASASQTQANQLAAPAPLTTDRRFPTTSSNSSACQSTGPAQERPQEPPRWVQRRGRLGRGGRGSDRNGVDTDLVRHGPPAAEPRRGGGRTLRHLLVPDRKQSQSSRVLGKLAIRARSRTSPNCRRLSSRRVTTVSSAGAASGHGQTKVAR